MADHYLDVVNEKDEVIGKELKSLKDEKGFISRVVAIFIIDSDKKILLCKRHSKKKYAAGLWDLAACGSVEVGESYEEAAKRELLEETGINCELKMLDKFYEEVSDDGIVFKFFCGIFFGISDKVPKFSDELEDYRKATVKEIEKEIKTNSKIFCHGFINDFNQIIIKLKNL
jgi:isopentenyldiphosphate isomerase